MTSKQFINELAKNSGMTVSETTELMARFAELVAEGVRDGNSLTLQGFGSFEIKEKAEKRMFNPSTKEYRIIPACKSLTFRPSTVLKEKLTSAE